MNTLNAGVNVKIRGKVEAKKGSLPGAPLLWKTRLIRLVPISRWRALSFSNYWAAATLSTMTHGTTPFREILLLWPLSSFLPLFRSGRDSEVLRRMASCSLKEPQGDSEGLQKTSYCLKESFRTSEIPLCLQDIFSFTAIQVCPNQMHLALWKWDWRTVEVLKGFEELWKAREKAGVKAI